MILIDAVVTQMHARVPEVLIRLVVLDGREPNQALLVQVDEQRVYGGQAHVEAKVAFVPSDQKRLV